MIRTIFLWALVLAFGAFILDWLQYQYLVRVFSRDLYVACIATAFALGGLWLGAWLASRGEATPFEPNLAARRALGLTGQEMKVLEHIAAGRSNKEIARTLGLSPNTVKSHVARLFAKLEVGRRTQAVGKARDLHLIP